MTVWKYYIISNLRINKGKTIALVGSSGAGKSTLADLIPRFHDVSGGELLVDGINIKDYSLHALRDQMSIVTQEPVLFNDTIASNIALGTPDASPGRYRTGCPHRQRPSVHQPERKRLPE